MKNWKSTLKTSKTLVLAMANHLLTSVSTLTGTKVIMFYGKHVILLLQERGFQYPFRVWWKVWWLEEKIQWERFTDCGTSCYDHQIKSWDQKTARKVFIRFNLFSWSKMRFLNSEKRKEGLIKEKDLTIEALRSEISKLESLLSMFKNQKEIYELQLKVLWQ